MKGSLFLKITLFFFLLSPMAFPSLTDSLRQQLTRFPSDTAKVNFLVELLSESTLKQKHELLEAILPLYDSLMQVISKSHVSGEYLLFMKSRFYYSLARYYRIQRDYLKAYQACLTADSLLSSLPQDDPKVFKARIANQSILASIYHAAGLLNKAIEVTTKMVQTLYLKRQKSQEDTVQLITVLFNLGSLYDEANQPENALQKFQEVEKLLEKAPLPRIAFHLYLQLAQFYQKNDSFPNAYHYLNLAYQVAVTMQSEYFLNRVYHQLCHHYYLQEKLDSANFFCQRVKGLKESDEVNHLLLLFKLYQSQQKYQQASALISLLDSLTQANERLRLEYYEALLSYYEKRGNPVKALEIAKKIIELKASISNTDIIKAVTQSELKVAFTEQLVQERLSQEKAILLREEKLKRQRFLLIGISLLFLIVLAGASLLYNRYKIIQHQKQLIEEKNAIIEKKNKDILDSIMYAKRLQLAILPPLATIQEVLPHCWIFYQPREMVSGDFYWVRKKSGVIYFAVADCTGHGIPGAFLSMIGYNGLNAALEQLQNPTPSQILYFVHHFFIQTLQQYASSRMTDGMDIALACYFPAENRLLISGAKHTAYLIRRQRRIQAIRLDRTSIGFSLLEKPIQFTDREIFLENGDQLFFTTDGIKDQFGGSQKKKLGEKRLQQLFLSLTKVPFHEQQHELLTFFNEWKKGLEQLDDVCVLSVLFP